MTEATIDPLHAFDRELRQRDPRFVRVLSANLDDGQGEYELRAASSTTRHQICLTRTCAKPQFSCKQPLPRAH